MRLAGSVLVLLACLMTPGAWSWAEDAPLDLRVEARWGGHDVAGAVTVTIDAAGQVHGTRESASATGPTVEVVDFRIPAAEVARTRDAIVTARFFSAEYGSPAPWADGSSWTVFVRLDGQERRRSALRRTLEFEPLERHLYRFVQQVSITAALRRGDYHAAGAMPYSYFTGVAHLPAVVDELVACAAGQTVPARCGGAAKLLLEVAGPEDVLRAAQALLARVEGDCRAAVVLAWVEHLRRPENAARRRDLLPLLQGDAERTAARWATLAPEARGAFAALLELLLLNGEASAFELAERLARTAGSPERPFAPTGLVETGEAAVPVVVRLMDAEEPQARANGVQIAYDQIGVLRARFGLRTPLSKAAREALERRVGDEVVPALERRLRDPTEAYALRRTCVTVLDRWDGRCRAAQSRATERQAAARRREGAAADAARMEPPPGGPLSIAGRLIGPYDDALAGFKLVAVRSDGRLAASTVTEADGSFRLVGLAEGKYDLVEAPPGRFLDLYVPTAPRAARDVDAGLDGMLIRLPGTLIRGRVVDAAGAPLPQFDVIARPRGSTQEWPRLSNHALTDAEGRFVIVRLPPDVYDVVSNRSDIVSLRDGVGLEPGPEERRLAVQPGAPISGRLLDEAGAPSAGTRIELLEPDPEWFSYRSTQTSADGSFRFEAVEPLREHRLHAVATAPDGTPRGVCLEGVRGGAEGLMLRIGPAPHLRFRVNRNGRGPCEPVVDIVRIAGGPTLWHRFDEAPVDWVAAPAGTWKVRVRVLDLDAEGVPGCTWVDAGTVRTGEPERELVVPR